MTSVAGGVKGSHIEKDGVANHRASLGKGNIHGRNVILIEGNADELVPNIERAAGMHGFVIMVPPSERDNWLLDLLWRVTMAYAGLPRLLRSRSIVQKMVEAVMDYEYQPIKRAKPKPSSSAKPKK